jgi:hypothetical protein
VASKNPAYFSWSLNVPITVHDHELDLVMDPEQLRVLCNVKAFHAAEQMRAEILDRELWQDGEEESCARGRKEEERTPEAVPEDA